MFKAFRAISVGPIVSGWEVEQSCGVLWHDLYFLSVPLWGRRWGRSRSRSRSRRGSKGAEVQVAHGRQLEWPVVLERCYYHRLNSDQSTNK